MRAWLSLRSKMPDQRAAFGEGFKRLGYAVEHSLTFTPGPKDALLIWNRFGENSRAAAAFEARGLTVLVAENAYLQPAGERMYAISRNRHNGAGTWPHGGPERWQSFHVELRPWRTSGETVILAQRGIGEAPTAMPRDWPNRVAHLGRMRLHPGRQPPRVSLEADLSKAGVAITWGSGAAIQALVFGVPVFCALPQWIGASAARPLDEIKAGPKRDDAARLAMFERLAYAQWRVSEIASGAALRVLIECTT